MTAPIVLVTGASGFIGRALVPLLLSQGFTVRAHHRRYGRRPGRILAVEIPTVRANSPVDAGGGFHQAAAQTFCAELGDDSDDEKWQCALEGVDHVIHLAGIAHRGPEVDPTVFERVNERATIRLARQASVAGVKRFVFVSSINAMGDSTTNAGVLTPDTPERPADDYGRSKLAAEHGLRECCANATLQWCIVRPPLVYGPGAKGSLARLMKWIRSGLPVPAVRPPNRRAMIGLQNLSGLLAAATTHSHCATRILLPADSHWSTAQLAATIGAAMGHRTRQIPVPAQLLQVARQLTGRTRSISRLSESLNVYDPWLEQEASLAFKFDPSQTMAQMACCFYRSNATVE